MTLMTAKKITIRLARERETPNTVVYQEVIAEGRVQPLLFSKPLYPQKDRLRQLFGGFPDALDLVVTPVEDGQHISPALVPDILVREKVTMNCGAYGSAALGSDRLFWGKQYIPKLSLLPFGEVPYRLQVAFRLPEGK